MSFSDLSRKQKIIFLAWVFEGEGSYGYWSNGINRRRIELTVTMSDEDIINRFKDVFDCGYIGKTKKKRDYYKQCWSWCLTGLKALHVLEQMLPFFGVRRASKYNDMVESFRISVKNGDHVIRKHLRRKTNKMIAHKEVIQASYDGLR